MFVIFKIFKVIIIIMHFIIALSLIFSSSQYLRVAGIIFSSFIAIAMVKKFAKNPENDNINSNSIDNNANETESSYEDCGVISKLIDDIFSGLMYFWTGAFLQMLFGGGKQARSAESVRGPVLIKSNRFDEIRKPVSTFKDDIETSLAIIEYKKSQESQAENQERMNKYVFKEDDAEMDSISANGAIEPNIDDNDVEMDSVGNISSDDLVGLENDENNDSDKNSDTESDMYGIY